jgi:hypothetical protein
MLALMSFLNYSSFSLTEAKAESEYGLMMDDNNYKSKYPLFEKEVIECNNFNLNVNDNDDGGDVAANTGNNANNDDDENNKNDDIVGQLLGPKQGEEEETEINRHSSSISEYDSKDSQSTVICKSFNNNEVPSTDTETLTVIKKTACQADTQTCQQIQIQPSNFTIVIEEGNNPSPQNPFPGSSAGTDIQLEPGDYSVSEEGLDPIIPEICNTMGFDAGRNASAELGPNLFICTSFSNECEGEITLGNPRTCFIDNVLVQFTLTNGLDLAIPNFGSDNVSILLGTGTGSFGTATNFTAGDEPTSVAVGDFNNDTNLDLAVANQESDNVSILLGTGTGSFGPPTNFTAGNGPTSVAVGNFNGDTNLDLAVANFVSNNVSILLGTGTGSFGPPTNFPAGSGPVSVAIGKFNGDAFEDLAIANQFSSDVSILLGTGTGSFGAPINYPVGNTPLEVAVGEFN